MRENLQLLFSTHVSESLCRALRCLIFASNYCFANINSTIRLRESSSTSEFRILLEGAPESVIEAIAQILLAKIYRKLIFHCVWYRRYVSSHDMTTKAHLVRQVREAASGIHSARGFFYDLEEIFAKPQPAVLSMVCGETPDDLELPARAQESRALLPTTHSVVSRISHHPAYCATSWNTSSTTRCFT